MALKWYDNQYNTKELVVSRIFMNYNLFPQMCVILDFDHQYIYIFYFRFRVRLNNNVLKIEIFFF